MKFFNLGFCIFILCIFINNSIAQEYEFLLAPSREVMETGLDNRSLAMGKTTTTTSRSSSAIFSNPSILATFSKPQFQVGGKLLYGTTESETVNASDFYHSYEDKYPIFPNRSYLAVAVPYQLPNSQLKLVFGVGYQRNEGVKRELEIVQLDKEWSDVTNELVDVQVTSVRSDRVSGALSTITPGIAINLQDKYYIGLAINRTLGGIMSTAERKRPDSLTETDVEQEQSAQFLRIGALAKVTPEFSLALMYRPGFDWEFGETITKTVEDGELNTERSQTDEELTIPPMWGIGAEYKVSPEFIVALEIQSRPFTDLEWRDEIQRAVIDNGYNLAVGAEYLGSGFPIRFGAFRDVIPYVDENDTTPVSFTGLTVGAGSNSDKSFSWDASALYGTWERTVNAEGQKYSENLIRASISGTYRFNTGFGSSDTK